MLPNMYYVLKIALKCLKQRLLKYLNSFVFCKACRIQRGDGSERHELMEAELNGGDDVLRKRYLTEAASVFACDGIKGIIMFEKHPH